MDELQNRSGIENRYSLTDVHIDDAVAPGRRRYGLWKPPALRTRAELPLLEGTYDRFTVTRAEIGRIDKIADKFYKDVTLWWAIAYYNNIANPITDLVVGQILLIPRKDFLVRAAEQGRTVV